VSREIEKYFARGEHFYFSFIAFNFNTVKGNGSSIFFRDSILRSFVALVKNSFRDDDMICRLCPNNFIFIAKDSSIDIFSTRIKKVLEVIEEKFPDFKEEHVKFFSTHILNAKSFDHNIKIASKNLNSINKFRSFPQFMENSI